MSNVVIVSGARTPIGAMGGAFKDTADWQLAAAALCGALERAGMRAQDLEELVLGNVISTGRSAYNPRRLALEVGMRQDAPSYGVNQLCGSGMRAAHLAWQSLRLGERRLVAAGGTENMSRAPYLLSQARFGQKLGHQEVLDALTYTLTCGISTLPMGITAENIAERYGLTREEQDAYAVLSNARAVAARHSKRFAREIVPVQTPSGLIEHDERPQTSTLEDLARLRPTFKPDGTVTAANASGINDGAAMLLLADEDYARAQGLPVMVRVHGFASVGVDRGSAPG